MEKDNNNGDGRQQNQETHSLKAKQEKQSVLSSIEYLFNNNAFIPYSMIATVIDDLQYKRAWNEMVLPNKKKPRVTGSIFLDAVILYLFFQYTDNQQENQNRLNDNAFECSRSYACTALRWAPTRYSKAYGVLECNHLVTRETKYVFNKQTGQILRKSTFLSLAHRDN